MKFSIITVCLNSEKLIEATMQSVLEQTYNKIEYIIVDGRSEDSTLDIINKVVTENNHDSKITIKVISEPDNGLYDAMNKGVLLATGDYIQFLNAGDTFANEYVLEKIAKKANTSRAEILYGNVIYTYSDGTNSLRKYGKWCAKPVYFLTGDSINHQCVFASKSCFDIHKFDSENLKICADREWLMRMLRENISFVATNITICNYLISEDSVSVANEKLQWDEAEWCIKRHYKGGYPIYSLFKLFRNNWMLSKILHCVYERLFIEDI